MDRLCDLKRILRRIYSFESELKVTYKLSINEAMTLCTLQKEEMSSGELALDIGLSPGRMSRVLGELENKGLVRRRISNEDKRVMFFSITEAGSRKIDLMKKSNIDIPEFT